MFAFPKQLRPNTKTCKVKSVPKDMVKDEGEEVFSDRLHDRKLEEDPKVKSIDDNVRKCGKSSCCVHSRTTNTKRSLKGKFNSFTYWAN